MRSALALVLCGVAFLGSPAKAQDRTGQGTPEAAPEGEESAELQALRLAEQEIFGRERALVDAAEHYRARLGEPPAVMTSDAPQRRAPQVTETQDLGWLRDLTLPDIPIRWAPEVVRYLEFYRDDPRGRSIMRAWLRRRAQYGPMVTAKLRELGMPEDVAYIAMIESGFDPTARSHAGAVGMWQFVRATGEEYGLSFDHWVDERMDPEEATVAGARYLRDLHRRFGSWELAFAAYNMGYGALLRAMRKYNTNDYWVLARLEAGLPFETTFYVAKVMACAIVGRNPAAFGFGDLELDGPLRIARVEVPGGTPLLQVARAADLELDTIDALNPAFRRGRTPPGRNATVRIPADAEATFARNWTRRRPDAPVYATHVVRFGETLGDVARRYRTSSNQLREINELPEGARAAVGTSLLVPAVQPRSQDEPDERPVVAVPAEVFDYPDRRRVFYRVTDEDSCESIAGFFSVSVDELRRWNNVEPDAALQEGMLMQLFVPGAVDLARAVVLTEDDVRVLVIGTDEFFDYHEAERGRVRFSYTIREGDTLTSIGNRFDLSTGSLARINRFSRGTTLQVGQQIVVYAPRDRAPAEAVRAADARLAEATGQSPTPAPPIQDDGDGEDEASDTATAPDESVEPPHDAEPEAPPAPGVPP